MGTHARAPTGAPPHICVWPLIGKHHLRVPSKFHCNPTRIARARHPGADFPGTWFFFVFCTLSLGVEKIRDAAAGARDSRASGDRLEGLICMPPENLTPFGPELRAHDSLPLYTGDLVVFHPPPSDQHVPKRVRATVFPWVMCHLGV